MAGDREVGIGTHRHRCSYGGGAEAPVVLTGGALTVGVTDAVEAFEWITQHRSPLLLSR